MKIVVDINHPAHVHYFKHFIWEMEKRQHQILITASDKDITFSLLKAYDFQYVPFAGYGKNVVKKLLNIPIHDIKLFHLYKKFNPDVLIGFGSIGVAHVGWILRKKVIMLADTEHAVSSFNILNLPFSDVVLTPISFQKELGKKQVRFKGTTDLLYLYPNHFTPNPNVLKELGLTPDMTYIIVRFISWTAHHDIGIKGVDDKVAFVQNLERYGRVLITSEGELPAELEKNRITISPEKIHDLMYYATLFIGESGTMATESASMGVHAVVVNPEAILADGSYTFGVFQYLHDYGLLYAYNNEDDALNKVGELFGLANLKEVGKKKRKKLLLENDDVTDYLVKYVEEYLKREA